MGTEEQRAAARDALEPIVLVDRGSSYRDGAESVLVDLVSGATDITSTSDEMLANAVDWPQRYHVDPARANVLRALDLPADAVVLEVGSGCGAITRYLGETVAHVDSLEPVPSRARVARLRTRDLPNVDVFVGQVQDLPDDERYDVVVVVGVLEYVGNGSVDPAPYREFLDACHRRLRPGGSLVLAIENRFGVKYLAGAPEDHYGVPYVGVDGYARGELARTFSRRELVEMLEQERFGTRSLIAFPDYKLTRVVFDPERLDDLPARELLAAVPTFPSPDWTGTRAAGPDERRLWSGFVDAGLAADTGNSLVMLAHKGERPAAVLWPAERAGRYFSRERRPGFTSVATVVRENQSVVVRRAPLVPDAAPPGTDAVTESEVAFVSGTDLVDRLTGAELEEARALFSAWHSLADGAAARGELSFDFVPHNLRVAADGSLVFIDDEWRPTLSDSASVLRRGVVLTAVHLQRVGVAGTWGDRATGRDLAVLMGSWVGLGADDGWIAAAIDREAELQVRVGQRGPVTTPERLRAVRAGIEAVLDTTVGAPGAGVVPASVAPDSAPDPADLAAVAAAVEADAEFLRRLELGDAAILALAATEKRTADLLESIQTENAAREAEIDRHAALHVEEVRDRSAAHIRHLEDLVRSLTARLDAAELGIREAHASTSWRVTTPLRVAARAVKKHDR
ncbi:class I SAM-dependent methyltransferase [Microbacteriaceae bacterium VKM Ac-2855]|nr:class I SAM-dependent methyltransferase [Microbacteriaceae bacterium VKM Ac-2855]